MGVNEKNEGEIAQRGTVGLWLGNAAQPGERFVSGTLKRELKERQYLFASIQVNQLLSEVDDALRLLPVPRVHCFLHIRALLQHRAVEQRLVINSSPGNRRSRRSVALRPLMYAKQ